MSVRIQLILDEAEWDEWTGLAREEGVPLSAWLLVAARVQAATKEKIIFRSTSDLELFFAACDERESGREPNWIEHLRAVDGSRAQGRAQSE